jgi:hypothetical protein
MITDNIMLTHIVFNMRPRMYSTLLTMILREINHRVSINLDDLKEYIRKIYTSTKGGEDKKEVVLSATAG